MHLNAFLYLLSFISSILLFSLPIALFFSYIVHFSLISAIFSIFLTIC
jgi:hypothetical protein